ncbi:ComF family protein [Arthrobacter crusticola]|uniref:ComF family protein n=1 Tax=Arthrobacter crusticola TaxID=2547960 RepID=A0A4R5TRH9_9MICC|nr:phosphoribosyltransferase family protein [Arthrobacter crusticola]TDK23573.1 ComF family protein [Arthrobacter crusticola]
MAHPFRALPDAGGRNGGVPAAAGRALRGFWALILPTSCVGCGRHDSSLCRPCRRAFRRATVRPFRAEAGAGSLPLRDPAAPQTGAPPGADDADGGFEPLPVVAAGIYGGVVARALLAFKNAGHTDLARPLAAALGGALLAARAGLPADPCLLVPVPTRGRSLRRRGYDPLGLLLDGLRRRGELPAGSRLARPVAHRHPGVRTGVRPALMPWFSSARRGGQKGLGRRGRQENVAGSMRIRRRYRGRLGGVQCLVVDDVLTTGATLAEVVRTLRAEGAAVACAVVLAATPPPSGTESAYSEFRRNRRGEG